MTAFVEALTKMTGRVNRFLSGVDDLNPCATDVSAHLCNGKKGTFEDAASRRTLNSALARGQAVALLRHETHYEYKQMLLRNYARISSKQARQRISIPLASHLTGSWPALPAMGYIDSKQTPPATAN